MSSKNKVIHGILRFYLETVRIMPQMVLLFLVYFGSTRVFGWDLSAELSAIIVCVFWGSAEMGDLVRGSLKSIPVIQYESAMALGMNSLQTFLFIIFPQILRRLVPLCINLVTRMIKTTSLVTYKISKGTPSGTGTEVVPTLNIYQQLLSAYGKTDNSINKEISERKSAISTEKAERKIRRTPGYAN